MTKQQEIAVNKIRADIEKEFFYDKDTYEVKKWEVEECKYFVSVAFEVGIKNDEGTLASIFCRDRGHLFVGKRGGLSYYNKRGTLKKVGSTSLCCI